MLIGHSLGGIGIGTCVPVPRLVHPICPTCLQLVYLVAAEWWGN